MKQLQSYTYTIPALGSVQIPAANDNFIVLASTGPVSVRGDTFGKMPSLVAGQGLKMVPFQRLELIDESGAPNTVTILLSPVEFVNQVFSGSVTVTAASVSALTLPSASTGNFKAIAALAGNTPETLFLAGANVSGAILLAAQMSAREAAYPRMSFVAKATAPATVIDGEIMLQSKIVGTDASAAFCGADLQEAQFIPAGLGLFFISEGALGAGAPNMRSARYRLL